MKIKAFSKTTYQTFPEVDGMIEITNEQYAGLQAGTHRFNDSLTAVIPKTQSEVAAEENARLKREEEQNLKILRARRAAECFSIINRGQPWYDMLTEGQIAELNTWYHKWLDVTDTRVVPEKPSWIK